MTVFRFDPVFSPMVRLTESVFSFVPTLAETLVRINELVP